VGAVLFGSLNLYASGAGEGYEDAILIHRDKNSNTAGVKQIAASAKSFPALVEDISKGRVTHVIALGGVAPAPLGAGATIVAVAAHDGPLADAAAVVLPATSWAEHSGTYVNAKGMRQVSEKALEPQGASRPAWAQLADLATCLGYEVSVKSLKQIRSRLVGGGAQPVASSPAIAPAE
jgi:NADH dehydrogenase/NADH:ubiquinone oxidoreductase subunit G